MFSKILFIIFGNIIIILIYFYFYSKFFINYSHINFPLSILNLNKNNNNNNKNVFFLIYKYSKNLVLLEDQINRISFSYHNKNNYQLYSNYFKQKNLWNKIEKKIKNNVLISGYHSLISIQLGSNFGEVDKINVEYLNKNIFNNKIYLYNLFVFFNNFFKIFLKFENNYKQLIFNKNKNFNNNNNEIDDYLNLLDKMFNDKNLIEIFNFLDSNYFYNNENNNKFFCSKEINEFYIIINESYLNINNEEEKNNYNFIYKDLKVFNIINKKLNNEIINKDELINLLEFMSKLFKNISFINEYENLLRKNINNYKKKRIIITILFLFILICYNLIIKGIFNINKLKKKKK